MKKRKVIKLNESDIERLVKKIIKEDVEESSFDIKDVDNWMSKFKQYFINKAVGTSATKKINTVAEQAAIVAALMEFFNVTPTQINKAKQLLMNKRKEQQKGSIQSTNQSGGEEDLNFDA